MDIEQIEEAKLQKARRFIPQRGWPATKTPGGVFLRREGGGDPGWRKGRGLPRASSDRRPFGARLESWRDCLPGVDPPHGPLGYWGRSVGLGNAELVY